MEILKVKTRENKEMIDITKDVAEIIRDKKWLDGIVTVFIPHTTAAVTINENADRDVVRDILSHVQKLVPRNGDFHHAEGNSDAHILASFFGSSVQVILVNGKIQLGTWQSIYFCEFDGGRNRSVYLEFVGRK